MRFVHTADNHLDMPLSSLPPDKAAMRRAQRLSSFSEIISYTIAHADMLLISGDLFDSPAPPQSVLNFCREEFKRLGNIPVFIALGNHDYSLNYNFPGNVHIFPPYIEKIEYMGTFITGASFAASSAFYSGLIPQCEIGSQNILCIHGDTLTQSTYNPLNKDVLVSLGYDYIALGHIHNFSKYKNIVYPGCHDGAGFDELGEKCFVFGTITPEGLTVKPIPSSSLIYREESFDISAFSSSIEIVSAISEKFSDGIYSFSLTGTAKEGFSLNIDAINSYLADKFFYAKATDNTSIAPSEEQSFLEKLVFDFLCENYTDETARLAMHYANLALKGDEYRDY